MELLGVNKKGKPKVKTKKRGGGSRLPRKIIDVQDERLKLETQKIKTTL